MIRKWIGMAVCLSMLLGQARAEQASVATEIAAKEGDWGYRPQDGATATLNPPSLTWVHDPKAKQYTVQWASDSAFTKSVTTISNHLWCVYTHHKPLEAGTWYWRFRGAGGWSKVRSVVIPKDAVTFPLPSVEERQTVLPKTHPRLFLRPEDLPRIRQAIAEKGSAAEKIFIEMKKQADKLIKAGPTPEPTVRGSARDKNDEEAVKHWWPNRKTSDTAGEEAELMSFVWMISQEPKYGEAARKFVMALAAWDPDGPSNFDLNCESGKAMLYHPVRAYDWAYDALTEEDRVQFRKVWQRRGTDAWKNGETGKGNGHLSRPYGSHGNRVWHKLAEIAIGLHGEIPESEIWLDYALNKFYAVYPVWSDDDGGWHEGLSYMSGYITKVTDWMQVSRSALGIDGMKKPFFSKVGDMPLYLMSPNSPNAGMGDLSWRPASCSFMDYFTRVSTTPEAAYWSWWLDASKSAGKPSGWKALLSLANLPQKPAPKMPFDKPVSKIFKGTGLASLHTTLTNSLADVHILFKADPFGTQSHGHNAQLGIQLNAFGECLLPANTYRDLHGSKFHYQFVHETKSQNSVLINGAGQRPHSLRSAGSILESQFTPAYDYVRGEATAAYTNGVGRAERAIVFVKPDIIVVFDDFETDAPAQYQFMLHGLSAFTLDEAQQTAKLTGKKAGLTVRYFSSQPLRLTQTDGFNPPPKGYGSSRDNFPNHWHLEASTSKPVKASDALMVLNPYRNGEEHPVQATRIDSATASGLRLMRGTSTIDIAFRKAGVLKAEWQGQAFTTPVWVLVK